MGEGVVVRGVRFGEGMPQICVSFAATDNGGLLRAAAAAATAADLLEWRADYYGHLQDRSAIYTALAGLRGTAGEKPLLFTLRSAGEGGRMTMPKAEAASLLQQVAQSGMADMVDVEYSLGQAVCRDVAGTAKAKGALTVVSRHELAGTPPEDGMLQLLLAMREAGADIPKLAVTPHSADDILALFKATSRFTKETGSPAITMAMGKLGAASRVVGGYFGSCVTFGSVGRASAPGQLPAGELRTILAALYGAKEEASACNANTGS